MISEAVEVWPTGLCCLDMLAGLLGLLGKSQHAAAMWTSTASGCVHDLSIC